MYQKVVLLHRSLVKFLSKAKHKSLVEWIIGLNWQSRSDARLKYVDSLSTSRTTGGLFPRTTPLVELVVGSERLSELIPQTVVGERATNSSPLHYGGSLREPNFRCYSIAKHLSCDGLLHYKFIIQLAGERILKSVNICQRYRQNCWLCHKPRSPYTFALKDAELAR